MASTTAAGSAGGVVERDRLPLVGWYLPGIVGVAFSEQCLVVELADQLAVLILRVVDADDQRPLGQVAGGALHQFAEFLVDQQHLGFAVLQDEGDGFGIQAGIDGIQHRAAHGHAEVCLEHRRAVRRDHRHRIAQTNAAPGQGRGQTNAAAVSLAPGLPQAAVDQRRALRGDTRRALEKTQGAERLKVRRITRHTIFVWG